MEAVADPVLAPQLAPRILSRFKAVQAVVILATLGLLSAGIYGTCNIKVEFDPFKMLSQDSYLKQFLDSYKEGKGYQKKSLKYMYL